MILNLRAMMQNDRRPALDADSVLFFLTYFKSSIVSALPISKSYISHNSGVKNA